MSLEGYARSSQEESKEKATALMSALDFWRGWLKARSNLHRVRFKHCIIPEPPVRVELRTFCDASEEAFADVHYLRSIGE